MQWYDYVLEYGPMIVSLVVAVVMFLRTKNSKYIKEVYDVAKAYSIIPSEMKVTDYKKDFEGTRFVKQYRLNKSTGELEEVEQPLDVQALVDSCKDYCLQACLERFMPSADSSELEEEYSRSLDDRDLMRQAVDLANEYSEKFDLSPDLSVAQIFAEVQKRSDSLKSSLDKVKAAQSVQPVQNIEKGGDENA